jgi:hypothetical protein
MVFGHCTPFIGFLIERLWQVAKTLPLTLAAASKFSTDLRRLAASVSRFKTPDRDFDNVLFKTKPFGDI